MRLARAIFILLFLGALSAQASDRFFLELLCVEDDAGVHHAETVKLWVDAQPIPYEAHGLRLSVAAHLEPDRTLVIDHKLLDQVTGYQALSSETMKVAPGSPPPAYSFAIQQRKFSVILKGAMVPKAQAAPAQAAPAEPPPPEGVACRVCNGSGVCQGCQGLGKKICGNCHGGKLCTNCSGAGCNLCGRGKCGSCGGAGYIMLCVVCDGSKKCQACSGSGRMWR
ncbi:MAG: hypothetical protein AB7S38_06575 [Vulcanimicrobiota bacterium]